MQQTSTVPEPEDLRTEYQVSQEAANGVSLSYWSFAGIFLGLSATALGVIVPKIFEIDSIGFKVFVTLISIGMIVIYSMLDRMLGRYNERIRRYYKRIRDIEELRGMKAEHQQQEPRIQTWSGSTFWRIIICTLGAFWLSALGFAWSI